MTSSRSIRDHRSRKASPSYFVPALDKGLNVLEALANSETPLSLTELARVLDQTPSAFFRILSLLEQRSYVIRDPVSGKYRLSMRLFELAHTYSPVEHIITASGRPMRELADAVRESVHLSVLSHGRLVVLLDVGSPLRVRLAHQIGSQFSPVLTNSGRLLLAYLSPEALEEHLQRDADYAQLSQGQRKAFHRELKEIRCSRCAVSSSEGGAGMKDLAVLAGNPSVGAAAALAIACFGGGKSSADTRRLLSALRECAARITDDLGVRYDHNSIL